MSLWAAERVAELRRHEVEYFARRQAPEPIDTLVQAGGGGGAGGGGVQMAAVHALGAWGSPYAVATIRFLNAAGEPSGDPVDCRFYTNTDAVSWAESEPFMSTGTIVPVMSCSPVLEDEPAWIALPAFLQGWCG